MSDSNWWETAKVGDVVECVDDSGRPFNLKRGEQYTIDLVNPPHVRLLGMKQEWFAFRFRPVPKPQVVAPARWSRPEGWGELVVGTVPLTQSFPPDFPHLSQDAPGKGAGFVVCLEVRDARGDFNAYAHSLNRLLRASEGAIEVLRHVALPNPCGQVTHAAIVAKAVKALAILDGTEDVSFAPAAEEPETIGEWYGKVSQRLAALERHSNQLERAEKALRAIAGIDSGDYVEGAWLADVYFTTEADRCKSPK